MKLSTWRSRIVAMLFAATLFAFFTASTLPHRASAASAAAEYLIVGYARGGELPGVVAYSLNSKTGVLQGQWTRSDTTGQILSETATPVSRGDGVAGKYSIVGVNPNGGRYSGDLVVSKQNDQVYQFAWSAGDRGVGILVGNVLAVGYGSSPGVVVYKIKRGERAEGLWTATSVEDGRVGKESFSSKALVGSHATSGLTPDGRTYAGRVDIAQQGNVYLFKWNSGDNGVGLLVTGDGR